MNEISSNNERPISKVNINLPLAPGTREAIDELRGPSETRVGFIRTAIDRELQARASERRKRA